MKKAKTVLILLVIILFPGIGIYMIYPRVERHSPSPAVSVPEVLQNYIFSKTELSEEQLLQTIGAPICVRIIDKLDDKAPFTWSHPYLPSKQISMVKAVHKNLVTRGPQEPVLNFARRVAITLRSKAYTASPYYLTEDEKRVFHILGQYPVVCGDLAMAFMEIMRQNGIWANFLNVQYKDNVWDSHATVEIYDPARKKWIIVDPTFVGVFTLPDGTVLGPGEIQANIKNVTFTPFDPAAGYHQYYVSLPLLFTRIGYKGTYVSDFQQRITSPDSPYFFRVEKAKLQNGWIYFWRSNLMAEFLPIPNADDFRPPAKPHYRLNLPDVLSHPKTYAHGDLTSVQSCHDAGDPNHPYLAIQSDKGGGLRIPLPLSPGKMYLIDIVLRMKDIGRKTTISYQDINFKQWRPIEGDGRWTTLRYLVIPRQTDGKIFLYSDSPIKFDVKEVAVSTVE